MLLIAWVPLCLTIPVRAIVDNALLLETYQQLAVLTAVNTMALVFAVTILRVLNDRYGPSGIFPGAARLVGQGDSKWGIPQTLMVECGAVVTPLVLAWARRYSAS